MWKSLFLLDLDLEVCVLLGVFLFHLNYLICWHTVVLVLLYILFLNFCKVDSNVPSFTSDSSYSSLSFCFGKFG